MASVSLGALLLQTFGIRRSARLSSSRAARARPHCAMAMGMGITEDEEDFQDAALIAQREEDRKKKHMLRGVIIVLASILITAMIITALAMGEPEAPPPPSPTPTPAVALPTPPAPTPTGAKMWKLEVAGRYSTRAPQVQAAEQAEIVAWDGELYRAFVANSHDNTVEVVDFSSPSAPRLAHVLDFGTNRSITAVDVSDRHVAASASVTPHTDRGYVYLLDRKTFAVEAEIEVGHLPDTVTFTPDYESLVVGCEGEPSAPGTPQGRYVDPPGSIWIIDVRGPASAISAADVHEIGFTAFDEGGGRALPEGVRISNRYPNGTRVRPSQDLEPEKIAVSADSTRAFVALQENNAIAHVDVPSRRLLAIWPAGVVDRAHVPFDASDHDGGISLRTWGNVVSMRMPDGIKYHKGFLFTANEGDTRVKDEARVASLSLSPTAFPDAASFQRDANLGRLIVSSEDGRGPGGGLNTGHLAQPYSRLYAFGGRSFSVFNATTGHLVFDSGADIERRVQLAQPKYFNADQVAPTAMDVRSPVRGAEPEGIDVGVVDGRSYAFITLERQGGLIMYDVTDPKAPFFVAYANPRDFAATKDADAGDLAPEGVRFISNVESPTGAPLVLVANSMSGTTTCYRVVAA